MIIRCLMIFLALLLPLPAQAATNGPVLVEARGNRQLKMAVEIPRSSDAAPAPLLAREMAEVVAFDMNMAGTVAAETRELLPFPEVIGFGARDFSAWVAGGFELLVHSEYIRKGEELTVEFRMYDVQTRSLMASRRYLGQQTELRRFAHAFADEVMLALTGERGCFTTRVAFVSTETGNKEIAVMDWDGYNLRRITSNGSINLNPDFSPDGSQLIFTSYKRGNPDLYRRLLSTTADVPLSHRKGLNITGTWSPDGNSIALAFGHAATHAPQPMHAAASIAAGGRDST